MKGTNLTSDLYVVAIAEQRNTRDEYREELDRPTFRLAFHVVQGHRRKTCLVGSDIVERFVVCHAESRFGKICHSVRR